MEWGTQHISLGTTWEQPQAGTTWDQPQAGTTWEQPQAGTTWERPQAGTTWDQPQAGRTRRGRVGVALAAFLSLIASLFGSTDAAAGSKGANCDAEKTTTLSDIGDAIGLAEARAAGLTGTGIDVAVIDTGVNPIFGLDVIDGPDLSFDSGSPNLRHRDLHGHGTNMATIIGAEQTSTGEGIAPGVRIINVKAGAADGAVDVSQVIAAIDWVVEHRNANGMNIRVLNLSYGTDADVDYRSDPLSHAVDNAWRNGIVVVAAAGNEARGTSGLSNPALNPTIIAVGGAGKSTSNDSGWTAANWTTKGDSIRDPEIVAPGECVLSAGMPGSFLYEHYTHAAQTIDGDTYLRGSGTSQSAAAVSGAVALLLEDRPWLSPDEVKSLIISNGKPLSTGSEQKPKIAGHGLLDLAAMLDAVPGQTQAHAPSYGTGPLDAARGTYAVGETGDELIGEFTAFGTPWDATAWTSAVASGTTWTDGADAGSVWTGGSWLEATWSSDGWSVATWSATWSGSLWDTATWSTATWSTATWSEATWSTATWSTATWSEATWSTATWSDGGWG